MRNKAENADAFLYPVYIIALRELGDVFGVAVCRAEDVSRFAGRERTACPDANGLCTFFIGDGPGGLDVDEGMRDLADKLVAYLECDNANVETVYVDGVRAPDGRDAPGDATARERDYRVGSDYATGVRVVVEGERCVGQGPRRARRSHFRRGHYSRYRVGLRDRWHYETRWVRPTFVHGCGLSVTEHKVIRIVL